MADRAIRVGIAGWTYAPWRGGFYPKGLRQADELAYASRRFGAIEVNGTFYGLQKPASFAAWAAQTPDDFVFTLKAPRFITHVRRLRDPLLPIANFLASGPLVLGRKLGPILWQLPPGARFDADVVEEFLSVLPHGTAAAAALAARHETRLKGRAHVATDADRPLRHAMEVRHESFADPDFIALLRRHQVALVVADTSEHPRLGDLTADFVYCRLHGATERYASGYSDAALDEWAARMRAWSRGAQGPALPLVAKAGRARKRDVYAFFDNTMKEHAPENAAAVIRRLQGRKPFFF